MKEGSGNGQVPEKIAIVVSPQAFLYDEKGEIVDEALSGWAVAVLPYFPEYTLEMPSQDGGIEVLSEAERVRYTSRALPPIRVRVRTHYGYEGFMNPDCLSAFSSYEAKHRDRMGRTVVVTKQSADILLSPRVQSPILRTLSRGAFLTLLDDLVKVPEWKDGGQGGGPGSEGGSLPGAACLSGQRSRAGERCLSGEKSLQGAERLLEEKSLPGVECLPEEKGLPGVECLSGGRELPGVECLLGEDGLAEGSTEEERVQTLLEESPSSAWAPDRSSPELLDGDCLPEEMEMTEEFWFPDREMLSEDKAAVSRSGYVRVMTADGRVGFISTASICRRADSDGLLYENGDGGWLGRQVPEWGSRYMERKGLPAGISETEETDPGNDAQPMAESEALLRARIVQTAQSYLGTQYRWGGHSGEGIDCSGLALMSYMMSGILIWRDAEIRDGYPVHRINPMQKKPGDLLYFPGHVAIYLGDGRYIHSTGYEEDFGVVYGSLVPGQPDFRADLAEKCYAVGSIF